MVVTFTVLYDGRDELNDWVGMYDGRNYKHACFRHAALEAVTHERDITVHNDEDIADPCDYCREERE